MCSTGRVQMPPRKALEFSAWVSRSAAGRRRGCCEVALQAGFFGYLVNSFCEVSSSTTAALPEEDTKLKAYFEEHGTGNN